MFQSQKYLFLNIINVCALSIISIYLLFSGFLVISYNDFNTLGYLNNSNILKPKFRKILPVLDTNYRLNSFPRKGKPKWKLNINVEKVEQKRSFLNFSNFNDLHTLNSIFFLFNILVFSIFGYLIIWKWLNDRDFKQPERVKEEFNNRNIVDLYRSKPLAVGESNQTFRNSFDLNRAAQYLNNNFLNTNMLSRQQYKNDLSFILFVCNIIETSTTSTEDSDKKDRVISILRNLFVYSKTELIMLHRNIDFLNASGLICKDAIPIKFYHVYSL